MTRARGVRNPLLAAITRFDATQLAPWLALRNTLGVAIALGAGLALHNLGGGILAATGALDTAFSDGTDPYPHRARRMLTAAAFVALAVFAGRVAGANHGLAVTLEAVCGFAAGMMVAAGETAGNIGSIALVTLIVYAAQAAPPGRAAVSGLLVFAGGVMQTLLSVAFWPVRRFRPEARALAALYAELARTAEGPALAMEAPPATATILAARQAMAGLSTLHSVESERYLSLFSQAERIRLAVLTLLRLRARLGREPLGADDAALLARCLELAARMLASVAGSLDAGVRGDPHPERLAELKQIAGRLRGPGAGAGVTAMRADARRQVDALAGQLRIATELAAHASPDGLEEFQRSESTQPWQLRLAGTVAVLRANLSLRSAVFRHAVRLAACAGVCDLLARSLHWERTYWAAMTAVIVLRPDFITTLSRGVLRLAGTFLGLALTTAIFTLLAPAPPAQILFVAAFMFAMRFAGGANYGLFVVPLTGLVVLLFALSGVTPEHVIVPRGLNTLAGGIIALAANRLWPTWERTLIHESLAGLLDAYRDYFQAVRDGYLRPGIEREPEFIERLDRARQAGRLARTNATASAARYRMEGGVPTDRLTALEAILANSHRFIHAVMALEAGLYRSSAAPARAGLRDFANAADTTLYFLAAYLRGTPAGSGDLPDLREIQQALAASGDAQVERYALVNIETDRIANSLNTLALEIAQWIPAGYNR
ncbi:MAG: FUSC family protein [Acidobacteria bacterium]|nr:FUSC family protein [Acidobacteriota bacterium]